MKKNSYVLQDLLDCSQGKLFGPGNAQLPAPPMLMFENISLIQKEGGKYDAGLVVAQQAIRSDLWFFSCHFPSDPVMPGCLGLDAMWQLLGFYLGWLGHQGKGRALGSGEVAFTGQILPDVTLVQYTLQIRKVVARSLVLGIADGEVSADGKTIYQAKDLRVGLFREKQLS